MVVDDLHFVCVSVPPNKANPPLFVYPNAVLALAVPLQRFEAVTGWRGKVPKLRGGIEYAQLPSRDTLDPGKAPDAFAGVQPLRVVGAEAFNHLSSV